MTAYIGAENVLEDYDTISASAEATGFEVINLVDRRTSTWWKPETFGSPANTTVDFTFATPQTFDYIGIIGHNLQSEGCSLHLQYADGSGSPITPDAFAMTIDNGDMPSNNGCIFRKLSSPVTTTAIRIFVSQTTADMVIASIYVGQSIALPEGLKAPFRPTQYGRNNDISNNVTEGGQFIGRSKYSSGWEVDIEQTVVDPDWVTANYDTLIDRIEVAPFFFVWDYEIDNSPSIDNSAYCWTNDITHAKYTHNGKLYMDFMLKCDALRE